MIEWDIKQATKKTKGEKIMKDKMKVAVMTAINEMKFEEQPVPTPKADEALVKLEYVGICGSDMHYFEKGRIGDFVVTPPIVLGHECAGTIVKLGENVKHLKIGDRVSIEPGITCKTCPACRKGEYNLCADIEFFATPPYDGVFQEYVAHEATMCFKLPDNVSTMEGALIEPLAIGFYAAQKGKAKVGQKAVVFGAGCIGLVSMLALKASGVSQVYVVDGMENRLEKAVELGANGVVNFKKDDPATKLKELVPGGVDLVIETSGAPSAIKAAIDVCRLAGTIVMVGYSEGDEVSIPMNSAINKELCFESIFRYRHIYPIAIEAVAAGDVNIKNLVSHTFNFDDLPKAMEECSKSKDVISKAVVKI